MKRRVNQQRKPTTEHPILISVVMILFAILAAITLLLVTLDLVDRAISAALDGLWRLSPILGVVFVASGCLLVSTLFIFAGGQFWDNRSAMVGYLLFLAKGRPEQFGPWKLESETVSSEARSGKVLVGTSGFVLASTLLLLVVVSVFIGGSSSLGIRKEATNIAGAQSTPTVRPTATPLVVHYPPATQADLRGFATMGNASAIHVAHSENVGLVGACPQPRREVWIDPRVTGQQLAEDLLAFFYGQRLDSPCGSLVVAYNSQSEADAGDYYTAGRVNLDVYDSSGQYNADPNATDLKYTVTLDVG